MSKETLAIVIVIVIVLFLIGSLSTVQKSAKKPLRKKGLNDLQETLPRSQKTEQEKPSFSKK